MNKVTEKLWKNSVPAFHVPSDAVEAFSDATRTDGTEHIHLASKTKLLKQSAKVDAIFECISVGVIIK